MPEVVDPRMISVTPRIRYNTIGGVNGPLVILDNVRSWRGERLTEQELILVRRSNSRDTTRLCPLLCLMEPSALDRSLKLEVSYHRFHEVQTLT
jgi:hypothetical protein